MKRIALMLLLAAAAPAFAQDAAVPKAAATCFSCHGENGAHPIAPNYPVLAGQYANYLEHALTEYKEGKRKNPIMGAQAAALSGEDIHQLAEFFSEQPSNLHTPSVHVAEKK
ncbi:MAG TPA: cytochrome c [Nevskiaceae bacterium]|nr:cytochrome c [Nevskiaceae bacterium]